MEEKIYVMIEDIDKEGNVIFDFAQNRDYEKFLSIFDLKRPENGASMILIRKVKNQHHLNQDEHYILNVNELLTLKEKFSEYDSYLIAYQLESPTIKNLTLFSPSDKQFYKSKYGKRED